MRYVIAMVCAVVGAAAMMVWFSSDLASGIVAGRRFDNPDDVADLHAALFMAFNAAGLIGGWILGWMFGGLVVPPVQTPE